jgi:hypothetical protein
MVRPPADLPAVRAQTLHSLQAAMSGGDVAGAGRCADRLYAVLPQRRLADNIVLVAYGGGKDSSYTLAFVRAIQLILFMAHGSTFRLRAVTNRHAGMPQAVMDNIDRAYRALRLLEDPDCEALLVDGDEVKPFRREEPLAAQVVRRNRLDLLMTGHRTFAEARPTFCNGCNLSMVNAFGLAAAHGDAVDVVITGDSPQEQRAYYLWVTRLARRFGRRAWRPGNAGFRGFLEATDDIAQAYYTEVYGPDGQREIAERRVTYDVPPTLRFFSIFDDTRYSSSDHWQVLTQLLGFEFDEVAFSFTESDCGNPTLMAHLRGLKCERLYGRSYGEGLDEYVEFGVSLMRSKEFPARLIETMRARYTGPDAATRMRAVANEFAGRAYGVTEEQLTCMVYAPLAGKGERLERYLDREQPQLAGRVREIHALLSGETGPTDATAGLVAALERLSGLDLERLRTLYRSPTITLSVHSGSEGLVGAILAGDPHKAVIETRHTPHGPVVPELLSGR